MCEEGRCVVRSGSEGRGKGGLAANESLMIT